MELFLEGLAELSSFLSMSKGEEVGKEAIASWKCVMFPQLIELKLQEKGKRRGMMIMKI